MNKQPVARRKKNNARVETSTDRKKNPLKKSRKTRKEEKKKKTQKEKIAKHRRSLHQQLVAVLKMVAEMIFIRFFSGSVEICCFPMVCDDVPIYKW